MKKTMMIAASVLMMGSIAMAADGEHTATDKVDHSHNPITGTDTTTKTYKEKMKDPATGGTQEVNVKEKTKAHKNGKVEKSVKMDSDATSK